jgi:hypothetical protein
VPDWSYHATLKAGDEPRQHPRYFDEFSIHPRMYRIADELAPLGDF